jgi:hypothetical protein
MFISKSESFTSTLCVCVCILIFRHAYTLHTFMFSLLSALFKCEQSYGFRTRSPQGRDYESAVLYSAIWCRLADMYQCCRGPLCFHLEGNYDGSNTFLSNISAMRGNNCSQTPQKKTLLIDFSVSNTFRNVVKLRYLKIIVTFLVLMFNLSKFITSGTVKVFV